MKCLISLPKTSLFSTWICHYFIFQRCKIIQYRNNLFSIFSSRLLNPHPTGDPKSVMPPELVPDLERVQKVREHEVAWHHCCCIRRQLFRRCFWSPLLTACFGSSSHILSATYSTALVQAGPNSGSSGSLLNPKLFHQLQRRVTSLSRHAKTIFDIIAARNKSTAKHWRWW